MRKTLVDPITLNQTAPGHEAWLDVGRISRVALTSEDPGFPIESVFRPEASSGWRAGGKGEQAIRLTFEPPQRIQRIWLRFIETEAKRTQEISLRWRSEPHGGMREIVRQQWNFSPRGSTMEVEDFKVDLEGVSVLELTIIPDLSSREFVASLAEWYIA
ncbi:MAG TPA: hypothetical protein VGN17_29380 [Bryobacteraceae bacterium]|jgi:hypothetical protein